MVQLLIVDDDSVDREQAARSLEPLDDLAIRYAGGGSEALAAFEADPPDVVLTDLRMPGMDGLELTDRLQRDHPAVPVIVMTSRGSEQIAVEALERGASGYVRKRDLRRDLPRTIQQIIEIAAQGVSRRRLRQFVRDRQTRFAIPNDVSLIAPIVTFLQEDLGRLGLFEGSDLLRISVALTEAIGNGIVHGNLEIGSDLRDESLGDYYRLIEERSRQQPYADRRLRLSAHLQQDRVEYVVGDEGPGFDHASQPDPTTPENLVRVGGRGLMLIATFMDDVRFNDSGNVVTLVKQFD